MGFRNVWHDGYYALTGVRGAEFAMRCRDVTARIDLRERPWKEVFRFRLHLSLCRACHDYARISAALSRGFHMGVTRDVDLGRLNRKIIDEFSARG